MQQEGPNDISKVGCVRRGQLFVIGCLQAAVTAVPGNASANGMHAGVSAEGSELTAQDKSTHTAAIATAQEASSTPVIKTDDAGTSTSNTVQQQATSSIATGDHALEEQQQRPFVQGNEREQQLQPSTSKPQQQQQQQQRHSYSASNKRLTQLVQPGFSSCIIAAPKLHTVSLLMEVLPLLTPSCTFVVYSPWIQPLAEAMHQLSRSKRAVMLQLQESWLRPYQVSWLNVAIIERM